MDMFNQEQRAYMDYLAKLPVDQKCDCGWAKRGQCFGKCYGHADKGGALPKIDDTKRGLYQKYHVERLQDPAGKHKDCPFFVLDIKHDFFARAALRAYIGACREEYPDLAADLEQLIREFPLDIG